MKSLSATSLHQSLAELGVLEPGSIFDDLVLAYREETRHYHGESHIIECLNQFARYRSLAEHPARVEVAFWFHDAIYDTTQSDNELRSAQWATRYLNEKDAEPTVVAAVADMINATATHQVDGGDSALMLDIDLGILGTAPAVFEAYDQAIRAEYHWVPLDKYLEGRVKVLRSFLDRDRIYQTDVIYNRLETQARENLSRKIDQLKASR
jgi:predicted metal-dependent HD superfamily phosphohydrolase